MPGLRVNTDGTAGPYVIVPSTLTDRLARYLKQNKVDFWITKHAIIDASPDDVINPGYGASADRVQQLLDQWKDQEEVQ